MEEERVELCNANLFEYFFFFFLSVLIMKIIRGIVPYRGNLKRAEIIAKWKF